MITLNFLYENFRIFGLIMLIRRDIKLRTATKLNLIQNPKLDIKSFILLVYIYYLIFIISYLFSKSLKINIRIWLTFIVNAMIMSKINF